MPDESLTRTYQVRVVVQTAYWILVAVPRVAEDKEAAARQVAKNHFAYDDVSQLIEPDKWLVSPLEPEQDEDNTE